MIFFSLVLFHHRKVFSNEVIISKQEICSMWATISASYDKCAHLSKLHNRAKLFSDGLRTR